MAIGVHLLRVVLVLDLVLRSLLNPSFATSMQSDLSTRFDFGTLTPGDLTLLGDAHLTNATLYLSGTPSTPTSTAGRALFSRPILLRHPTTNHPLPFSTFFTFSITQPSPSPSPSGGGLAFLITSDAYSLGSSGKFLGIIKLDSSGKPNRSTLPVIAVEFDTMMDVDLGDLNDNHVGLDLNGVISTQVTDLHSLHVDLKSGNLVNAWVEYSQGLLQVYVSYSTVKPEKPAISADVDFDGYLNDHMFVGFSASTERSTEGHYVEWWSFATHVPPLPKLVTSHFPPPSPPTPVGSSPPYRARATVVGVATVGGFLLATLVGFAIWVFCWRPMRRPAAANEGWSMKVTTIVEVAPREFSYRELSAATGCFDAALVVGRGGCGAVYRGELPGGAAVAVKRCAAARAELLSELAVIGALRHRNLVRIRGWCNEKNETLLVYDYMPNGSLDRALFGSADELPWRRRRDILAGVASALAYLHGGCEHRIIHRDVKSGNVMLDAAFNARLGDFGLATMVERRESPEYAAVGYVSPAGTVGYMSPEYVATGMATEGTDVYGFGVVALEVVSGRRAVGSDGTNLVEWVWGLHRREREMDAVDGRMVVGEEEEGEVRRVVAVALACTFPEERRRPSMRTVVRMLAGESEVPVLVGDFDRRG